MIYTHTHKYKHQTPLSFTFWKDDSRISIPGPALELPGLPHDEDGDDAVPVSVGQLGRIVDHSVGNRQASFFPALNQQLVVTLGPLELKTTLFWVNFCNAITYPNRLRHLALVSKIICTTSFNPQLIEFVLMLLVQVKRSLKNYEVLKHQNK